jgi:hypothetical protein
MPAKMSVRPGRRVVGLPWRFGFGVSGGSCGRGGRQTRRLLRNVRSAKIEPFVQELRVSDHAA